VREVKPLFDPFQHRLRRGDLGGPSRLRRFDTDDRQKALTDSPLSSVWSRKGSFREVQADIAAKTDRP
jgi:hypothetical protein